ncbi:hypothetical protein [Streptococcus sp. sy010]|uniref:hypothetical protein n=1 Tax=Streptococcus sp. sy010 TaxID=2600148 RepID=UPI0011B849C4|nr:hypothetical protein [Streptococcus sp. sy010]TWT16451.1 hypothetical protein FRX51_00625 [Streptococcus sp. sy010]
MGELELLAQDLRQVEAKLLRAWLWLLLWVVLLLTTIIFAFIYMANEKVSVGLWRVITWIFLLPALADPVFYCVLACMNLGIFCQMQWENIEKYEHECSRAELYLDSAIKSTQGH